MTLLLKPGHGLETAQFETMELNCRSKPLSPEDWNQSWKVSLKWNQEEVLEVLEEVLPRRRLLVN